jgi:hypothetical protein
MALDFNITTLTADERLAECQRIVTIFMHDAVAMQFTDRESDFVSDMNNATSCSPAQLNWLRRIKDKYL